VSFVAKQHEKTCAEELEVSAKRKIGKKSYALKTTPAWQM
jgi:hypothetical protein